LNFHASPENDAFIARCMEQNSPQVVSLVGAGGKTSALFWLARALARRGRRVLVTTTTRMFRPEPADGLTVMIEADFTHRLTLLRQRPADTGIVALFSRFDESENKVSGCLPEEIDRLRDANVADAILVEADGAHHCLLKAPAAHEPCVPACSHTVIALSGGAALNRPAHPIEIHRWPQFAAITGLTAGARIGPVALARLLAHPEGMFKNVPPQARRLWLINAPVALDAATLSMLARLADQYKPLDSLWVADLRQTDPFSHAWLRA
jgi:probable selenium-dependent hydroxylase accessory protein YqeC